MLYRPLHAALELRSELALLDAEPDHGIVDPLGGDLAESLLGGSERDLLGVLEAFHCLAERVGDRSPSGRDALAQAIIGLMRPLTWLERLMRRCRPPCPDAPKRIGLTRGSAPGHGLRPSGPLA